MRPLLSAPRCAAESTPRASPLTTVMPRDGQVRARAARRSRARPRMPRATRQSRPRGVAATSRVPAIPEHRRQSESVQERRRETADRSTRRQRMPAASARRAHRAGVVEQQRAARVRADRGRRREAGRSDQVAGEIGKGMQTTARSASSWRHRRTPRAAPATDPKHVRPGHVATRPVLHPTCCLNYSGHADRNESATPRDGNLTPKSTRFAPVCVAHALLTARCACARSLSGQLLLCARAGRAQWL